METGLQKLDLLKKNLKGLNSILVAFSGGVDSTFLAAVAFEVLGDQAAALTAVSPSMADREFEEAKSLAQMIGICHIVIESHELESERYRANLSDRCYFCKTELFGLCMETASELGIRYVADGFNMDDFGDYRPGRKAAEESGVVSPLADAGLNKSEIRKLSKLYNLPTWNKPATPCLSSRFPYGTGITAEKLSKVEKAEEVLRSFGFREFRARFHEDILRLEIPPDEMIRVLSAETRDALNAELKKLGFKYIALDLEGFRSGRMTEDYVKKV